MVAAGSAWGLALSHAGVPVHVWRCRRPFPYGGLDPLRRETSAATVAIHASGGAAPLDRGLTHRSLVILRREAAGLAELSWTQATPQGEKRSLDRDSRACAARFLAM